MKIRKVEISSFRAFDKVEDATFDFITKNNQTANFVSIYAPNGFGKTSFYDAVEWSITDQIERFHKNASEYTKLARENRKENSINNYFLKHHYSDNNNPGYVKVLTEDKEFNRQIPNSKVYDFKSKGERLYFKEVILSQELIDRFLKEEKAEDRYNSFVRSFPELNTFNIKLQNIIKIYELTKQEIKDLAKKIKETGGKQLKIDFENDGRVLDEINQSIQFLKEYKQELKLISKESFTDNDYDVLSNKIQAQLTSLPIEIGTKDLRIGNIDIAYNGIDGDETIKGIVVYFNIRNMTRLIEEQLNSFKDLSKLFCSIENNSIQISKYQKTKAELISIREKYDEFLKIEIELKSIDSTIHEIENTNTLISHDIKEHIEKEAKLNSDLSSSKIELNLVDEKITRIEPINKQIIEIDRNIRKYNKKEILEENISKIQKAIFDLNSLAIELELIDTRVKKDVKVGIEIEVLSRYKDYILNIIVLEKEKESVMLEKNQINIQIESQKIFLDEMQNFIQKGHKLISKHKSNVCPLCTQEYTSFIELSERIKKNKLLSELVVNLMTKLEDIERKLGDINKVLNENKEYILKAIKKIIEKTGKNLVEKINQRDQLLLQKDNLEILEKAKKEKSLFFEGLKPKDFFNQQKASQIRLNQIIIDKANEKEKVSLEIKRLQAKIDSNNEDIRDARIKINKLKFDDRYKVIVDYFNNIFNTEVVEISLIISNIDMNQSHIKELNKDNLQLNRKINEIKHSLKIGNITYEKIQENIKVQEKALLLNIKVLQNYEQIIKSDFNIELKNIEKDNADLLFEKLKKEVIAEKRLIEEQLRHYMIIDSLKEQSRSFLTAIRTMEQINELTAQLDSYTSLSKDLEMEKIQLQIFLKNKIDQFFYTALINKLYKKIDPHPDYEEIKFDCDFTDTSPRLQIYTKDRKGNYSVPALYFSSAQINILSLSIFLARALKAVNPKTGEQIKCIFIDDPIQSMDSINILSFIDLFRSLVVNLDRQIIVSTHEENFHLLLQKKIPEDIFKSKFIEFETFGKLKNKAI